MFVIILTSIKEKVIICLAKIRFILRKQSYNDKIPSCLTGKVKTLKLSWLIFKKLLLYKYLSFMLLTMPLLKT